MDYEKTPNPQALKFTFERPLNIDRTVHYRKSHRPGAKSPLAEALFALPGVEELYIDRTFMTVTLAAGHRWGDHYVTVATTIHQYVIIGRPLVYGRAMVAAFGAQADDLVRRRIARVFEEKIIPSIAKDGGRIEPEDFDPALGLVTVRLQGACSTCAFSSRTLANSVEKVLRAHVPEVTRLRVAEPR